MDKFKEKTNPAWPKLPKDLNVLNWVTFSKPKFVWVLHRQPQNCPRTRIEKIEVIQVAHMKLTKRKRKNPMGQATVLIQGMDQQSWKREWFIHIISKFPVIYAVILSSLKYVFKTQVDHWLFFEGLLIGIKGTYVKQIRSVTKCEVTLVKSNYEVRKGSKKSADIEPQVSVTTCFMTMPT